ISVGIGGAAAHNVLYAAIENGGSGDRLWGLFKSTNGGGAWSHVDAGKNGTATFTVADADPGPGTLNLVHVHRLTGPPSAPDGTWPSRRLLITPLADRKSVV